MNFDEAVKRLRQETCPNTYMPDFDKEECLKVIEEFQVILVLMVLNMILLSYLVLMMAFLVILELIRIRMIFYNIII